jgi:hypothetical protein
MKLLLVSGRVIVFVTVRGHEAQGEVASLVKYGVAGLSQVSMSRIIGKWPEAPPKPFSDNAFIKTWGLRWWQICCVKSR